MRNASKASTRKMLLRAMHLDDASEFRSILNNEGWPEDSSWSDYELLTHAIKHNHRRITHVLLDKKARITKPRQRNYSLLHLAAVNKSAGWVRVIERLLSLGACVADKNTKGQTALHRAFEIGAPEDVLETLLKAHLSESSEDVFNRDLLGFVHVASTRPTLNAVRQLVEADETLVNWQVSLKSIYSHAGYTPLHFAVEHGRLEIAEFLLRRGADIHRQNASGSTVLHLALELRNIEMIDLILRFDETKINRVNNFGVSHFMATCAGSNESLVDEYLRSPSTTSALLSSQVLSPKNSYPNSGYTPLHFAAEFGRRHTVELLLSRGADCCILTPHNVSAHLLAHANNHVRIADLLDKQCHSRRGSTEASKITITRYDKLIEHDEHGDVMISFAKRGQFDSSSEDDSDGLSDIDIARLSHDDLVSFFVNEKSTDFADQTIDHFEYDFLQSSDGEQICYNTQCFEQITPSSAPSNFPSYVPQIVVPDQFSVPIDNRFAFFNDTALYPTNLSVPSTLVQVSPFSPTQAIHVPHIYTIPWSPSSQNYFDFANQPISVDSGLSFSNSSGDSTFTDSGVDDAYSQNGAILTNASPLACQEYPINYATSESLQNFDEPIDLSCFVPVATSTPISYVPAVVDRSISFNQVVDGNNNRCVNDDKSDYYYSSISFP